MQEPSLVHHVGEILSLSDTLVPPVRQILLTRRGCLAASFYKTETNPPPSMQIYSHLGISKVIYMPL
jgi:hypothetical protein